MPIFMKNALILSLIFTLGRWGLSSSSIVAYTRLKSAWGASLKCGQRDLEKVRLHTLHPKNYAKPKAKEQQ